MRRRVFEQRVVGAIQSMTPGTVGGRVSNASPVRRVPNRIAPPGIAPVPFSLPGAVSVSESGPWVADENTTLTDVRALLRTAGTSSTVVAVNVNGVSAGTVTLSSGATTAHADINAELVKDSDVVTMKVTSAGTSAADLTVIARFA